MRVGWSVGWACRFEIRDGWADAGAILWGRASHGQQRTNATIVAL